MEKAYFVHRPRTAADLRAPHRPEAEQAYETIARVRLAKTEYENFITDMLVERAFLDPYAEQCAATPPMQCVLIQQGGQTGGILVVTEKTAHVLWAAIEP